MKPLMKPQMKPLLQLFILSIKHKYIPQRIKQRQSFQYKKKKISVTIRRFFTLTMHADMV